jgi:DNA repair protein RadC
VRIGLANLEHLRNIGPMDRGPAVEDASPGFWPAPAPAPAPKPHHLGHRDRLRDRARAGGLSALPDYELLELYLFRSIPQKDVKPLAKALIARFGSLAGVWAAGLDDLRSVDGVGEAVALDLKLVHEAAARIARAKVEKRTLISSSAALNAYVRVALAHEPREQFRVLFLDKKNALIADEVLGHGTVDHAPVYPREVVRRALGSRLIGPTR